MHHAIKSIAFIAPIAAIAPGLASASEASTAGIDVSPVVFGAGANVRMRALVDDDWSLSGGIGGSGAFTNKMLQAYGGVDYHIRGVVPGDEQGLSGLHLGGRLLYRSAQAIEELYGYTYQLDFTGLNLEALAGYRHSFDGGLTLGAAMGAAALIAGSYTLSDDYSSVEVSASTLDNSAPIGFVMDLSIGYVW